MSNICKIKSRSCRYRAERALACLGVLIGLSPGEVVGSYAPEAYHRAFAVALVFQVLGFVWLVWPRRPSKAENQRV